MPQKTALVTGGAQRIGKSIALKLAQLGYNIALHYHKSQNSALQTCSLIKKKNVLCQTFSFDLSIENNLPLLIHSVKKCFNDFQLLVNNASVFQKTPFLKTSFFVFNQNFNINFKAPFFLSLSFAQICQKGHIINILDSKINHNHIHYSPYTLSKKALANLTSISAKELAPHIRVNAIAPGYILPPHNSSPNYQLQRPKNIPLKIPGNPSHITQALEFLVLHPFITGQIVFVDGGEHL